MLTSHCAQCGQAKTPDLYGADFCATCQTLINETAEYVIKENAARAAVVAENQKLIDKYKSELEAGTVKPEEIGLKVALPQIDPGEARREALRRRQHDVNGAHVDPRAVFNPGVSDTRMNGLGMGAKVPSNYDVHRA
jgi:uncharacterized Zn finger protein (UPF0148 family)